MVLEWDVDLEACNSSLSWIAQSHFWAVHISSQDHDVYMTALASTGYPRPVDYFQKSHSNICRSAIMAQPGSIRRGRRGVVVSLTATLPPTVPKVFYCLAAILLKGLELMHIRWRRKNLSRQPENTLKISFWKKNLKTTRNTTTKNHHTKKFLKRLVSWLMTGWSF